ncbi:chain-length determining protein [Ectothiorhodospiraceae bacterium BW-2]|nr:chain-length determining protein [Ectothiorhodospiraceae bacterium BW-2]
MKWIPKKNSFRLALIASILVATYWAFIASDRYISEAHIVIQRTDMSGGQSVDFSAILTGSSSISNTEQLLLMDYLLSVDMLLLLDEQLDLRHHYSDPAYDIISRMWQADAPIEWFHSHYQDRTLIEFDPEAGILVIQAQAYTPEMAKAIASRLVEDGERYMNLLAHRLAREQVAFLEQQVDERQATALAARQQLLEFQNRNEMVSPEGTVQSLAATINKLEGQLTELNTKRSTMLAYLSRDASAVVEADMQIQSVKEQIAAEKRRLASSSGEALNQTVQEYQSLKLMDEFAQDTYRTALVALEKGRIDATRTLKKVSILQSPTSPQYPLMPERIYNSLAFTLAALILAAIFELMLSIIRDHQD